MPIVVLLRHSTFTEPASQARLVAFSATEELVLIGTHAVMPEGRVAQLRRMLVPRRMVALLVDDHMPVIEQALITDLLNDGSVPVILTPLDPPPPALTAWLHPAVPGGIPTGELSGC